MLPEMPTRRVRSHIGAPVHGMIRLKIETMKNIILTEFEERLLAAGSRLMAGTECRR
jgi:hypothetical protein